jgi:hypothetical protein
VSQLGAKALVEVLEPGRVPDCYLGLRLDPAGDAQAAGVFLVARPRWCIRVCHSRTAGAV